MKKFRAILSLLDMSLAGGCKKNESIQLMTNKRAYFLSAATKSALVMDLLFGSDYSFGRILQKTEIERLNSQVNLQLGLKSYGINKLKDFAKLKNPERKL